MEVFSQKKISEIKEDEKVMKIIHRHWFDIFKQFMAIVFLSLILLGSFVSFPYFFPALQDQNYYNALVFFESIFAIFIWVFIFFVWIDYYFDIWIITSEKIINVEQKGLFIRSLSELKLERIQDVTVEVKGIIPTFLNYGDVFVQTAGEKERFVFRHIPNPYSIKDMIMALQKDQIREETNELGEVIRKEIHKEIA